MDSKISQFVSQTGADAAVAKDLLQRTYFKKLLCTKPRDSK